MGNSWFHNNIVTLPFYPHPISIKRLKPIFALRVYNRDGCVVLVRFLSFPEVFCGIICRALQLSARI